MAQEIRTELSAVLQMKAEYPANLEELPLWTKELEEKLSKLNKDEVLQKALQRMDLRTSSNYAWFYTVVCSTAFIFQHFVYFPNRAISFLPSLCYGKLLEAFIPYMSLF